MKNVFIATILILLYNLASAQNTVLGKIVYDYSFVYNLKNPNDLYKDKMVLEFNKTSSVFKSQLLEETAELEKKRMLELFKKSSGNSIIDDGESLLRGTHIMYYNFYTAKLDYQYYPVGGTNYLIKEPLEKIDWKIEQVVKGIGGFGCQKATGKSHGRTYVAWFCTDIPYPYGPRKLWGLPGIILEAYDTENQISYKLNTVDLKPLPGKKIELPGNGVVTNHKEFDRMVSAMSKGALQDKNYAVSGGGTLTVTSSNESKSTQQRDLNPIDRQ